MLPMREPSRDSIDVSQAPGQHRRPDPTQANMLNFITTTTAAAAEANCKWKSKQPAVFGFWFLVLWLRFHNMTAATASALALQQLQQCNKCSAHFWLSVSKSKAGKSTAKGHKMCYSLLLVV